MDDTDPHYAMPDYQYYQTDRGDFRHPATRLGTEVWTAAQILAQNANTLEITPAHRKRTPPSKRLFGDCHDPCLSLEQK